MVRGSRGLSSAPLTVTVEELKVVTSETDSLQLFTWWTGDLRGHRGEQPLKWEGRGREV